MSLSAGPIASILQNVGPSNLGKDPVSTGSRITTSLGQLALGLAAAAGAVGIQKLAQTEGVPGVVAQVPFNPALAAPSSNPGTVTQQNPNTPPKNPLNPASYVPTTTEGKQTLLFGAAAGALVLALLLSFGGHRR